MLYILSYINFRDGREEHFDWTAKSLDEITSFMSRYSDVNSYSIIVVMPLE